MGIRFHKYNGYSTIKIIDIQLLFDELWVTSYELWVTSYELWVTSYELRVTSYELRVTSYEFLHKYNRYSTIYIMEPYLTPRVPPEIFETYCEY